MTNRKTSRDILGPLRPVEEDLVFIDALTGLYNRRLIARLFDDRWGELVSLAGSFALVMIDLDLFKEVNDRYGHLSGDEVLRATAEILQRTFRESDLLFRYGGDEFLILLPGASAAEAEALGERAREAIREHEFFDAEEQARIDVPLSFSIGVAAFPVDGDSGKAVLASADDRLYIEKRAHLATRRRKRRLITTFMVLAGAVLIALSVGLFLQSRTEQTGTPMVVVEPASTDAVVDEAAEKEAAEKEAAEKEALLAEIAELQKQIETLRATPAKSPVEHGGSQIEQLESKVLDLTRQLEERSVVASQPALTSSPEPASTEPPTTAEPVRRPTAPPEAETDPPVARTVVVVPPRLKTRVTPVYPPFAKRRGIEATIDLEILVDEFGRVAEAMVSGEPVGFGFEDAAREAALASVWTVGTRDGVPVPMRTTLQVRFQIAR